MFLILLGSLYFNLSIPNSTIYTLLLISYLLPIATNIYGNYEYFPKDFVVISKIFLHRDKVIISNREIELNSIKKIDLDINDWIGKKIVQNFRPHGSGPKLSMGINNTLKIHLNNSEQIELKIQLESNKQFLELGYWVKSLYKSKIEIKEKYEGGKSLGLENLNYKEIQIFKEKYLNELEL